MLFVIFSIGQWRYGLDSDEVIQISPLVNFTPFSDAPGYMRGLFNYRGENVQGVDLAFLADSKKAENFLSTRIIIAKYAVNKQGGLVGLIAEKVTETLRIWDSDFKAGGPSPEQAPFKGQMVTGKGKEIIMTRVENLLAFEIRHQLFIHEKN